MTLHGTSLACGPREGALQRLNRLPSAGPAVGTGASGTVTVGGEVAEDRRGSVTEKLKWGEGELRRASQR